MMKQFKLKFCIALVFLFVAVVCFYSNGLSVSALETGDRLHLNTKIYSSNNDDYFNGCEDYDNYVNLAPTITVLTHGLGSHDYYWSNNYSVENGKKLAYNSSSLINKIYENLDGQMALYRADGIYYESTGDFGFALTKYSYEDYINSNDGKPTSVIDDVSKHIVIVFNSSVADSSNYTVYNEFHTILDNISAQYKNLTGVLPRFNLVGHSRGGITNIMYAAEHPYNVASVFSLGTPYSGSVLGELEILLGMMGYTDENYVVDNEGVESIMNEEELQNIRNAWNSAYTADVNMNVVAYGSMTSIHLLRALIEDIEVNCEKYEYYGAIINDYSDLINSVINIIDDCPGLTSTTLNFVDGLARIFNDFGIDLFDILFTKINSNLEGKITYEEVRDVLGLVNVINNEIVIMDDLFIDLNSQLGYGFEDGISYNGFKRYTKIFGAADYTDNRAIPEQPGIVHNLEIMNETYMNDIANSLVLGVPTSAIVGLSDDFNGSYLFNLGKAFSFMPTYKGARKFTANGCTIKLYQYDANNCLQVIETIQNSLTYEYASSTRYLLIVEADSINNVGISFSLEDKMGLGDNTVEVGSGDKRIYKLTASVSGYYLISVSNTKILLSGATYITSGKYYVHLNANTTKYIYLTNSAAYAITVNVEVYDPNKIDLNQTTQIINSNQKVMKFTNPYNSSMSYKLDISWPSGSEYASIYNSNGSHIGSVTTSGTNKTYSFTLSAKQTCYVVYSSIDSSITSNLYINPTQLRWRIDGTLYDTKRIQLPRGYSYTIELVVLYNGAIVDYTSPYVNTSSVNFVFSNNKLSIDKNALIGYDITIYPTLAPDYLLTVQVGYDNKFSWSVSNSDVVTLSWDVNETFDRINFTITNKNGSYTLSKSITSFDITSYLPTSLGSTTIKLNSVVINGITFNNGTKFLNVSSKTVNNLFAGGAGTNSSPYTINCYRHLNNIRESTSSSVYYKLTQSINLNGYTWTSIQSFSGAINGNHHTLYNMKVLVTTDGGDYGFVKYLYGTIQNLNFSDVKIQTSNLSSADIVMYIGAVAGCCGSSGKVLNCDVSGSSTYDVRLFKAYLGGIVGFNNGYVYDSDNSGSQMNVSGYAGGIVGYNQGNVEYSYASNVTINYYWNTANGRVGGIVGYNAETGTISRCYSSGMFNWDSTSNNRDILPSLGLVVGHNQGVYSDCSTSMGYHIYYYYWHFIGWYDQSDRCFKVDGGKVGYQE